MARKPIAYVCFLGGPHDGLEWRMRGFNAEPLVDVRHLNRLHLYRLDRERSVIDGKRVLVLTYVHVPEGVADASSAL